MDSTTTVRRRAALGLSLLALGVPLALSACGGDDDGSPSAGAQTTATEITTVPVPARGAEAPNRVDRAFAVEMVPHHEGAIAMARLARDRAGSAFVRNLAGDVLRTQKEEIATLRAADRRLERAGIPRGSLGLTDAEMGMDHSMDMLRGADDFDRAFMEMMIPHHEGAIAMAQVGLAKGGDVPLRRLAQQIVAAQQGEIDAMRTELGRDAPAEHDSGGSGSHSGH